MVSFVSEIGSGHSDQEISADRVDYLNFTLLPNIELLARENRVEWVCTFPNGDNIFC